MATHHHLCSVVGGRVDVRRQVSEAMALVSMLDHINHSVDDLEASVDWYHRLFGFEVVERGMVEDVGPWAIIQAGEALICMYQHPNREYKDRFELKELGIHHVAHIGLRVSDKQQWEQVIEEESVEVLYGGAVEMPHSISWYIKDPSGWEIEVAWWPEGKADFTSLANTL